MERLYTYAADRGDSMASLCYLQGREGVKQDFVLAIRYLKKAQDGGRTEFSGHEIFPSFQFGSCGSDLLNRSINIYPVVLRVPAK